MNVSMTNSDAPALLWVAVLFPYHPVTHEGSSSSGELLDAFPYQVLRLRISTHVTSELMEESLWASLHTPCLILLIRSALSIS